jgi:putative ABC transport system substrate-binding protein
VPKATAIGVLVNPDDTINSSTEMDSIRAAARLSGQRIEILQASTEREIDAAFASLFNTQLDGLLVATDAFFGTQVNQLVTQAHHAIPTLYWRREFVDAGGLLSYGSHLADALRLAGIYAGRVLKGEKPADLPVQQPTRFDLVINLKTAKTLGLEISPMLLVRADEAIE